MTLGMLGAGRYVGPAPGHYPGGVWIRGHHGDLAVAGTPVTGAARASSRWSDRLPFAAHAPWQAVSREERELPLPMPSIPKEQDLSRFHQLGLCMRHHIACPAQSAASVMTVNSASAGGSQHERYDLHKLPSHTCPAQWGVTTPRKGSLAAQSHAARRGSGHHFRTAAPLRTSRTFRISEAGVSGF